MIQDADAKALLLAKKIGWLGPKHVDLAIKRCRLSKRSAMSARLEAASLDFFVSAPLRKQLSGPRRRL